MYLTKKLEMIGKVVNGKILGKKNYKFLNLRFMLN